MGLPTGLRHIADDHGDGPNSTCHRAANEIERLQTIEEAARNYCDTGSKHPQIRGSLFRELCDALWPPTAEEIAANPISNRWRKAAGGEGKP